MHKEKETDISNKLVRLDKKKLEKSKTNVKFSRMTFSLEFLNYNEEAQITGEDVNNCRVNFFRGNDSSKWCTDIPTFKRLVYKDIWKGIDLVFYNTDNELKYDFILNTGADIDSIKFTIKGLDEIHLDEQGNLVASSEFGTFIDKKPLTYQEVNGSKIMLDSNFVIKNEDENIHCGFELKDGYNPGYAVTIDPGLLYSTYLGGNDYDEGKGIAVDNSGNTYVTGLTYSTDFPTINAYQPNHYADNGNSDVFVSKINTNLSGTASLIYSTYLGGNGDDEGYGIAVDNSGNAYVIGSTSSTDFPTINAYQPNHYADNGNRDAFVSKINTNISGPLSLVYSTYLGGDVDDGGYGVAVDNSENAYVTGYTSSTNFPTVNEYQQYQGEYDVFVSKINTRLIGTPSLVYSTYLGGSGYDQGDGIAVDNSGNAYVTGLTYSTDFPTINAYQPNHYADSGNSDIFVSKINTNTSSLVYSTYLGGDGDDEGYGIAVDNKGNAYVTGFTDSTDFPTTDNAYDRNYHAFFDVFVSKINTKLSGTPSLVYSTYLGGDSTDFGNGIAVDNSENAYVTGSTLSKDFPTTSNAYQQIRNAFNDIFVSRINTKLSGTSSLVYSTYLGGDDLDIGNAIAQDNSGNAYVTGDTFSTDFPTTDNAFERNYQGGSDAFVTKLRTGNVVIQTIGYSCATIFTRDNNNCTCNSNRINLKCGKPVIAMIPFLLVPGVVSIPIIVAKVKVNTSCLQNPEIKLDFVVNIDIPAGFTIGNFILQVFKLCNGMYQKIPVGSQWSYKNNFVSGGNDVFSFFVYDNDIFESKCCTYTLEVIYYS